MVRMFQSRLGRFQDPIRRKLTDNLISLNGLATDCLRIRLKQTKQGDIETRTVEEASVVPIIFPPLIDVPYRKLLPDAVTGTYKLETLPAAVELFPIQIQTPYTDKIYIGDLIFRVFLEPNVVNPYVMVLEVKEALGTFGVHSIIWSKFNCAFDANELPSEIIDAIVSFAERRQLLGW